MTVKTTGNTDTALQTAVVKENAAATVFPTAMKYAMKEMISTVPTDTANQTVPESVNTAVTESKTATNFAMTVKTTENTDQKLRATVTKTAWAEVKADTAEMSSKTEQNSATTELITAKPTVNTAKKVAKYAIPAAN